MSITKTKKRMSPKESIKDAAQRGIKFSSKDMLKDQDFDMNQAKVRISTMIDFSIKEKLQKEAKKKGTKYQTLLNQILKEYFEGNKNIEKRVSILESKLERLTKDVG